MTPWSDTSFTSAPIAFDDYHFERFPDWLCAGDCVHQRYPRPITVCTRRSSDADANSDTHGYCNGYSNGDSDCYSYLYANAQRDSDTYCNSYHSYCDADPDACCSSRTTAN